MKGKKKRDFSRQESKEKRPRRQSEIRRRVEEEDLSLYRPEDSQVQVHTPKQTDSASDPGEREAYCFLCFPECPALVIYTQRKAGCARVWREIASVRRSSLCLLQKL